MSPSRWGPLGSIFAALCCLGFAPLLGAISAVGLGFLIDDRILLPLLAVFLGSTIWGLRWERHRHRRPGPERLAWAAALLTVAGLWIQPAIVAVGLALLVVASVWSLVLIHRPQASVRGA